MFRLVRNRATAISWLTTLEHTWFHKYKLRQIKNSMVDLGHPHIFTAILSSVGQFKICPF
jgi:hypothetical protein